MQERELIDLVHDIYQKKAEGQSIEVKATYRDCPTKLYDTLSSFSNQDNGGIIIFGIDETRDYAVVGVYDLQDLQKNVTEQCNQMEPPIRALFSSTIINGHVICSLEIPGLDYAERPCYYKGKGIIKGSYVRVGDADLPMTDYEVYSFEAFRRHLYDDERPVERASLELMDDSLLQSYILKRKIDRPGFSMLKEEQVLELMNITRNGKPTLAAVMNFCVYPQGFFPQLAITAVVVPGTEMGVVGNNNQRFLDNKRIEGTIKTMLEEAVSFSARNMKVQTIIDSVTGMRNDRTEYPIKAIREAVLNALIHRDYSPMTSENPITNILCFIIYNIDFYTL